jgi:hypothetical protein
MRHKFVCSTSRLAQPSINETAEASGGSKQGIVAVPFRRIGDRRRFPVERGLKKPFSPAFH